MAELGEIGEIAEGADAAEGAGEAAECAEQASTGCGNLNGCFIAGTPVQMADGTTKPIQDINVGDLVKTRSIATGITESKPVLQLYRPHSASLVTLHLATGDTITCTPNHPFYVAGEGFIPAGRLAIGNAILTRAGPTATVTSISWQRETTGAPFRVYNFEVEGDHTYFVGMADGGVWVHNACNNWGDQSTLTSHFNRHGPDFGASSEDEYAGMAIDFYNRLGEPGIENKFDPEGGVLRMYEPSTDTFGSYNLNGSTRTFFKPGGSGSYWGRQPGLPI